MLALVSLGPASYVLHQASAPPSGVHRRGRTPSASAVLQEITKVKGTDSNVAEAASFFVDAFWLSGTTTDGATLSGRERSQLVTQQTDDMTARYGDLVGSRRLESSLFVARDSDGAICGCVGVEAALVDVIEQRVLTRAQGEALFAAEFASMSGRDRGVYRKMDLVELTEELLPEYKVFGLLANLAVAPSTRRTGLARRLCACCDDAVDGWGLPAISLQVEEANGAARGLYEALEYNEIFRDEGASALRLNPGATTVASTLLLVGARCTPHARTRRLLELGAQSLHARGSLGLVPTLPDLTVPSPLASPPRR